MPEVPDHLHACSRPLKPSTTCCDHVVASPALGPSAPLRLSPWPPARLAAPGPRANAAANNAHQLTLRHSVDPRCSTDHVANRESDDLSGKSQSASLPFAQAGSGHLHSAQRTAGPHPVARSSAHLSFLPNPSDSPKFKESLDKEPRLFDRARNFTVTGGTFIAGDVTYNNVFSTQFMEKLLDKTILGAESDSSERDPPPRCHPETRLAILERCLNFISNCSGVKKMRWVFGGAGVGKSAIMQSVAESPELPVSYHVSIFFSINGRDDGTKAILTLSYQFAAKLDSYRQIIEQEITCDPSLLQSSMAKQFRRFIVEPFIYYAQLQTIGRVLVIIDGLDECKDHRIQQELLRLISDHCLGYPSSPLVWLIASRPEPHITSFLSRRSVIPVYEKEEIPIESDEGRADVERFLREKMTEIKEESDSIDPHWPEERDFWKLAKAAGGLFAYAQTVVKYIGDSRIGSPVSQLSDVLRVIDKHPVTSMPLEDHPMASLDALYGQILSNVPHKFMTNTRKLLLALASSSIENLRLIYMAGNFITLCNWLGMTADEVYAALNHLRSVLYIPSRDKAGRDNLRAFHKSFIDYISEFSRSKLFPDIRDEVTRLGEQCTLRVLNEVPDGIELGLYEDGLDSGKLAGRSATRGKISLTWLIENPDIWPDSITRLRMYHMMVSWILKGVSHGDPAFQSELCIRFLTIAFDGFYPGFPYDELHDVVFDPSRRDEFIMHGILKQIPLEAIPVGDFCTISDSNRIKLLFRRPAMTADPWNSSCKHKRESKKEAGNFHAWTTTFLGDPTGSINRRGSICQPCFERLEHQLENWKDRSHGGTALVLFTSARYCCVEVRLVDPVDGMSEWVYSFWYYIPWEEREKYGGAVYCTDSLNLDRVRQRGLIMRRERCSNLK